LGEKFRRDTAPADPLQVALKLHRLRRREALEVVEWSELSTAEQTVRVLVVCRLLDWLRRAGGSP
jgi:hypothetical protein